jgi:hypothetical protein
MDAFVSYKWSHYKRYLNTFGLIQYFNQLNSQMLGYIDTNDRNIHFQNNHCGYLEITKENNSINYMFTVEISCHLHAGNNKPILK